MSSPNVFGEVEKCLRASPGRLQHLSLPALLERAGRDLPPLDAFIPLGDRTALTWIVPRSGATLVTTDQTLIKPRAGSAHDYGMILLDHRAAAACKGVMPWPRRTMTHAAAAWLETVSRVRRRLRRG